MITFKIDADFGNTTGNWNWVSIYDPSNTDISTGQCAYNISLELKTGSAGSLTFTMPPNHPSYGSFRPLGVSVRVLANNSMIWFGRVLTIKNDFLNCRTITCEGGLAFLNDILVRPYTYCHTEAAGGEAWTGKTVHVEDPQPGWQLCSDILSKYNLYCSGKRHAVWQGAAHGLYSMYTATFTEIEGYSTTISALNKLVDGDTSAIIDWTLVDDQSYGLCIGIKVIDVTATFTAGVGTITLAQNLADYQKTIDGGDIYTQLIPMDKNKYTMNGASQDPTIPPDAVAGNMRLVYGNIEKVYNLSVECDDDPTLLSLAQAIITDEDLKNSNPPSELTVNALDMGWTANGSGIILPGYSYTITSAYHGLSGTYNCIGAKIQIDEPDSSSYDFLLPSSGEVLKDRTLSGMSKSDEKNKTITTESEVYTDEAPQRLIKIDSNHVAAVMGDRTEHYKISKFADDTTETGDQAQYLLDMYITDTPNDLPPVPTPNDNEEEE